MSRYQDVNAVKSIGVVGTGTIGASWAAYFLAQGFKVKAWDPANTWKVKLENFIESVWTDLEKLDVDITTLINEQDVTTLQTSKNQYNFQKLDLQIHKI